VAETLLLGPDKERIGGLRSLLRQDGHRVSWSPDLEGWRDTEREVRPELIIAAVPDAEPVVSQPGRPVRGFPAPLLFVHHDADLFREIHLDERIVDRLESPFTPEELLGRVDALVRVRRVVLRGNPDLAAQGTDPQEMGGVRGLALRLRSLLGTRVPRLAKPLAPYLEVAVRVAEWADRRDMFEPGHAERVASYSAMIADGLGLPDGESAALVRAALLHDIGKVALPVEVLRHRGPLAQEQFRLLRTHAEKGATLLRALDRDETVAETVLYHHERPDGAGYHGIPASRIPRAARILAVAEAYDAMTTSRLREAVGQERALSILREKRGEQFDHESVDALVSALKPRASHGIPLSDPPA
jgi:putative nucleotidyltransferase with HDIG domain